MKGRDAMSFIDIPTLGGGHVHAAVDSVYRITRSLQGDGSALTRVEFAGEIQLSQMPVANVAQLLVNAGAKLVDLTAPDGSEIFLAAGAITAVRAADPHIDPPGANAVVTVSGQRQAVRQTQQQVEQALSG